MDGQLALIQHQQTTEKKNSTDEPPENLLDVAAAVQAGLEARVDVVPCALVLVLLLSPDDLCVRIFRALGSHEIEGER